MFLKDFFKKSYLILFNSFAFFCEPNSLIYFANKFKVIDIDFSNSLFCIALSCLMVIECLQTAYYLIYYVVEIEFNLQF